MNLRTERRRLRLVPRSLLGRMLLLTLLAVLLAQGLSSLIWLSQLRASQMEGLLASARSLQDDLRRYARTADTSNSTGLQQVLQDATLALLRHPDQWVYANCELGQVPFNTAEATFNRLSMQERSKLSSELTSNVDGRRLAEEATAIAQSGDADATSEYIAVTLLVASRNKIAMKGVDSADQLRTALSALGAVPASELLALEVIWQPDGAGDVLSADELITAYPQLKHL